MEIVFTEISLQKFMELSAPAQRLFYALYMHMDGQGRACVSVGILLKEAKISLRKYKLAMKELISACFFERHTFKRSAEMNTWNTWLLGQMFTTSGRAKLAKQTVPKKGTVKSKETVPEMGTTVVSCSPLKVVSPMECSSIGVPPNSGTQPQTTTTNFQQTAKTNFCDRFAVMFRDTHGVFPSMTEPKNPEWYSIIREWLSSVGSSEEQYIRYAVGQHRDGRFVVRLYTLSTQNMMSSYVADNMEISKNIEKFKNEKREKAMFADFRKAYALSGDNNLMDCMDKYAIGQLSLDDFNAIIQKSLRRTNDSQA